MILLMNYLLPLLLILGLFACEADSATSGSSTTAPQAVTPTEGVPPGYELVWSDEFDYTGLPDPDKWAYQTGGHGWTAKNLQMYTKEDESTARVADGHLAITLSATPGQANPFKSARLVTKRKADFTEGYFEARIKFPKGEGLRSAFWMVGDTVSKIGWPNAGEIDIVEHYGSVPDAAGAAIQNVDNSWSGKGQLGGTIREPGLEDDFHVYGCLWTGERLEFYLDGRPYFAHDRTASMSFRQWPYVWDHYLVLTLSAGGLRGPQTKIDESALPASMLVDYIRVYQR